MKSFECVWRLYLIEAILKNDVYFFKHMYSLLFFSCCSTYTVLNMLQKAERKKKKKWHVERLWLEGGEGESEKKENKCHQNADGLKVNLWKKKKNVAWVSNKSLGKIILNKMYINVCWNDDDGNNNSNSDNSTHMWSHMSSSELA